MQAWEQHGNHSLHLLSNSDAAQNEITKSMHVLPGMNNRTAIHCIRSGVKILLHITMDIFHARIALAPLT
jgi:hypothetical protein